MFGHWTFSEQYNNSSQTSITFDTNPITSAATMLRGVIGFEVGTVLLQSDQHCAIGL
jgi:hypothetical protein